MKITCIIWEMIIKKENRGIIFGAYGQLYIKHALKYIMTETLLTFGFRNPYNSLFKDLYETKIIVFKGKIITYFWKSRL